MPAKLKPARRAPPRVAPRRGSSVSTRPAPSRASSTPPRLGTTSVPRSLASDNVRRFQACLSDPFSTAAIGAKVVDIVPAPTATFRLCKNTTLTSDSFGNLSGIILDSAVTNMAMDRGSMTGGTGWTSWTGTSINTSALLQTPTSGVAGQLKNYRIVGWGVRIRDIASMTNVSGKVITAKYITKQNELVPSRLSVGGASDNNAAMTLALYYAKCGIPFTGAGDSARIEISALTAIPEHRIFTGMELAEEGVQVRPKPVTFESFNFRDASDSSYGNDSEPGIATGFIFVGDSSYLYHGGTECVVFGGSGFPASTACLDVEIIYHLEGMPAAVVGSLVGSGVGPSPVSVSSLWTTLDKVSNLADFIPIPSLQAGNRAYKAIRAITA